MQRKNRIVDAKFLQFTNEGHILVLVPRGGDLLTYICMFFVSCQFRLYYEAVKVDLTSILCFLYNRNELEPISSSIMLSKLAVLFLKRE